MDLLNALSAKNLEDEKIFYDQHGTYLRGSNFKQAADIGAVYKDLFGGKSKEKIAALKLGAKGGWSIFYGLLLYIVEMKHQKGKMLFNGYKEDQEMTDGCIHSSPVISRTYFLMQMLVRRQSSLRRLRRAAVRTSCPWKKKSYC